MYKKAFTAFCGNFQLFALFAALMTILDEFDIGAGGIFVQFLIAGYLAFYSHRMILTGDNFKGAALVNPKSENGQPLVYRPFLIRFGLLWLAFFVAIMLTAWAIYKLLGSTSIDTEQFIGALILSLVAMFPVYGIVLSLVGTILPAAALNEDAGLDLAFARGKKTFWKTLGRLTVGSFLFGCATFAVGLWLFSYVVGHDVESGILYYSVSFLVSVLSCGITLLAATALSMAYQEVETPGSEN